MPENTWKEPALLVPTDTLKAAAEQHAPKIPSILDSIPRNASDAPYTLEEIEYAVFNSIFQRIALMANDLGYGWVAGVNSNSVGGDYVYVPSGTTVLGSGGYLITGPAFAPNLVQGAVTPDPGAGSGYQSDLRTSIEFIDVSVVQNSNTVGDPILETETAPSQITTFTVDNAGAVTPTSSVFTVTVFTQSAVGMAAEKNWSDSMHWDVSSTATFSAGGGMFPSASLSITGSGGQNHATGGSSSTSNNVTNGTTQEYSFSHSTPAGMTGEYEISATQGKVTLPFSSNAELVFGIKIHGFLRWGGGVAFHGGTNYNNQWSGKGDRPTVDAVFGGGGARFYEALQSQVSENAAPWAWNAMFGQLGSSRGNINGLISDAAANCKFPAAGAMMSIMRSNIKFKTLSEVAPTPA